MSKSTPECRKGCEVNEKWLDDCHIIDDLRKEITRLEYAIHLIADGGVDALVEELRLTKAALANYEQEFCYWVYDEEHDKYDTECKAMFNFFEGKYEENGYKHCPGCGKEISEKMRHGENIPNFRPPENYFPDCTFQHISGTVVFCHDKTSPKYKGWCSKRCLRPTKE
jgi:hypothetical protein